MEGGVPGTAEVGENVPVGSLWEAVISGPGAYVADPLFPLGDGPAALQGSLARLEGGDVVGAVELQVIRFYQKQGLPLLGDEITLYLERYPHTPWPCWGGGGLLGYERTRPLLGKGLEGNPRGTAASGASLPTGHSPSAAAGGTVRAVGPPRGRTAVVADVWSR